MCVVFPLDGLPLPYGLVVVPFSFLCLDGLVSFSQSRRIARFLPSSSCQSRGFGLHASCVVYLDRDWAALTLALMVPVSVCRHQSAWLATPVVWSWKSSRSLLSEHTTGASVGCTEWC